MSACCPGLVPEGRGDALRRRRPRDRGDVRLETLGRSACPREGLADPAHAHATRHRVGALVEHRLHRLTAASVLASSPSLVGAPRGRCWVHVRCWAPAGVAPTRSAATARRFFGLVVGQLTASVASASASVATAVLATTSVSLAAAAASTEAATSPAAITAAAAVPFIPAVPVTAAVAAAVPFTAAAALTAAAIAASRRGRLRESLARCVASRPDRRPLPVGHALATDRLRRDLGDRHHRAAGRADPVHLGTRKPAEVPGRGRRRSGGGPGRLPAVPPAESAVHPV